MWIGSVQIFHNNRDKVFILQEIDIYLYSILTILSFFRRIDARLSQKIMQDCVTFANIALAITLNFRVYTAQNCAEKIVSFCQ